MKTIAGIWTHCNVCIDLAKTVNCELVRIMSFRREMILFGTQGAEHWIISKGSWEKLIELLRPAVQLAEDQNVTLVLETGNNAMITSGYLGRKLLNEMGSESLKILWDPANSLYACEPTFPDGYEALGTDGIGHIHIKDCIVDMPKATVHFRELGKGQMAQYFEPLAAALKRDGYDGGIFARKVCIDRTVGISKQAFANRLKLSIDCSARKRVWR